MLCVFPSAEAFAGADWLEMKTQIAKWNEKNRKSQIRGLGDAKLMRLAAAFQFVVRIRSRVSVDDFRNVAFDPENPGTLEPVFRRILEKAPEKEHFYVLPVDAKLHPLCAPIDVSQGTITKTPVHPREVFCEATRYRARAIVVAHNHPDGDPEPSYEDRAVTRRLVEAGRILGIKLLDHLVVATARGNSESYRSIRETNPELFA
jgi:DNA repair protein RadC